MARILSRARAGCRKRPAAGFQAAPAWR